MNGKARRAIGKTATYVTLVIIIFVLNLPFQKLRGNSSAFADVPDDTASSALVLDF